MLAFNMYSGDEDPHVCAARDLWYQDVCWTEIRRRRRRAEVFAAGGDVWALPEEPPPRWDPERYQPSADLVECWRVWLAHVKRLPSVPVERRGAVLLPPGWKPIGAPAADTEGVCAPAVVAPSEPAPPTPGSRSGRD